MKIVYCIHALYNCGGMERVITNKVNYLSSIGYDVVIITTEQKERKPFFPLFSDNLCIDLSINYSDSSNNILLKMIDFILKKYKHRKRLKKVLFQLNADIVISTFGNEMSFLPKIKDGSKKVAEIHFSRYFRNQYNRKGLWHYVDSFRSIRDLQYIKKFDKFVVLTKEDKEYWGNLHNIVIIPNFIFNYPSHISSLKYKKVVAVGRLTYQKGYDILIKIWKYVSKECPDWILEIYGEGEEYVTLKKNIDDEHLASSIILKSPVSDIESVYLQSSVLVLSSRYEGLPMVLLEAMSIGLPIVAFACKCGPRDVIDNGVNGFLLETMDVSHFASKMILLMKDYHLRKEMGRLARNKSLSYSIKNIMIQWTSLFDELANC